MTTTLINNLDTLRLIGGGLDRNICSEAYNQLRDDEGQAAAVQISEEARQHLKDILWMVIRLGDENRLRLDQLLQQAPIEMTLPITAANIDQYIHQFKQIRNLLEAEINPVVVRRLQSERAKMNRHERDLLPYEAIREPTTPQCPPPAPPRDQLKEEVQERINDLYWYINRLAKEHQQRLDKLMEFHEGKLNSPLCPGNAEDCINCLTQIKDALEAEANPVTVRRLHRERHDMRRRGREQLPYQPTRETPAQPRPPPPPKSPQIDEKDITRYKDLVWLLVRLGECNKARLDELLEQNNDFNRFPVHRGNIKQHICTMEQMLEVMESEARPVDVRRLHRQREDMNRRGREKIPYEPTIDPSLIHSTPLPAKVPVVNPEVEGQVKDLIWMMVKLADNKQERLRGLLQQHETSLTLPITRENAAGLIEKFTEIVKTLEAEANDVLVRRLYRQREDMNRRGKEQIPYTPKLDPSQIRPPPVTPRVPVVNPDDEKQVKDLIWLIVQMAEGNKDRLRELLQTHETSLSLPITCENVGVMICKFKEVLQVLEGEMNPVKVRQLRRQREDMNRRGREAIPFQSLRAPTGPPPKLPKPPPTISPEDKALFNDVMWMLGRLTVGKDERLQELLREHGTMMTLPITYCNVKDYIMKLQRVQQALEAETDEVIVRRLKCERRIMNRRGLEKVPYKSIRKPK